MRNECILFGTPEGKLRLGRPRRGRQIILRWILKKTDWEGVDWIDLAQGKDR
jgi:hypothetical protein